jgi:PAS domain S-box-containing protein
MGKRRPVPAAAAEPAATAADESPRPEPGPASSDDEVLYHLSSLLDSVQTGIISLDGEGRVRVFNAVSESLFGVPQRSVLGRSFGALGRLISFKERGARDLWERLSDAVWAAGAALDLEYDLVRPSGQKQVLAYSVYPLGRLAWSVGNGVVILLDDITRKKEMEEQITDGWKRLQSVFDGITDGIQVVDTDFRITAVNKSMRMLIGASAAVGQHCYQVCSAGTEVCPDCPAAETFRTGQPALLVRRISRRTAGRGEGDERVLEISTFPLFARSSRVVHVVEYIKDVTDRVLLAERLEHARRLAELGKMAARVAHEVRNPLSAITGAAHFLAAEYPDDETIQKFTSLIKRQSLRVDQVASDILHASRPPRLNRTSVNSEGVVEQALASLRGAIEAQGITVRRSYDPAAPFLHADEVQIEQAVANVIRNAVEAMPGGGELGVSTEWDAAAAQLRISVEDTGAGIPDADRERIFDAFFTTKTQGTGLGLSIVEGVLKNHGGTIAVEQPGGQGARIVLILPAEPAAAQGFPGRPFPRSSHPASSPLPRSRRDRTGS